MKNILLGLFLLMICRIVFAQTDQIYSLYQASINSEFSEYSAIYAGEKLIWVSDNKPVGLLSRGDETTGRAFHDLFTNSTNQKIADLLLILNSRFHEGPLYISNDGNLCFFTRSAFMNNKKRYDDGEKMPLQLFYVYFDGHEWGEIQEFSMNSLDYSVGHPAMNKEENYLYFVSDMKGGFGGSDIYRVSFNDGKFGTPENLGKEVNSDSNELFPFISESGILYFSSDTKGGFGGLDVYKCDFDGQKFDYRKNMGTPFNSDSDDFGFSSFVNENNSDYGLISSNRQGGKGLDDVYYWGSNVKSLKLKGKITDKNSNPVANALINYTFPDGKTGVIRTDVNGNYQFEVPRNSFCSMEFSHEAYFNDNVDLSTETALLNEFIEHNLILEDFPVFTIKPVEVDGIAIQGMKVGINCNGADVYTGVTGENGVSWEFPHTYRRGDSVTMIVDFNKKGYLNRKITINMIIEDGGEIVIPRENLVFVKAEEKLEISKIIDLNPIYYDLAKWNIRSDAASELDKVIEFLNNNPDVILELSSHTDCRGSDKDNLALSEKRAQAAADYIRKGITNPNQIVGKGYGETQPVNECSDCSKCSEENHAANRRTEFTIVKVSN
jgi:outer membrane protein OmpA-like peptidoglycan-associated protein